MQQSGESWRVTNEFLGAVIVNTVLQAEESLMCQEERRQVIGN